LPDLLIGDNADENTLCVAPQGLLSKVSEEDLVGDAAKFTSEPHAVIARDRAARPGATLADLRVAILSGVMFGHGTRVPADRELAASMHASWVRFATTGSPGWPEFSDDRAHVEAFG
jgi:hypothetical protein